MTYYDVAIVGGGLAGLVAAAALERSKTDYVVIEARDRLGGRILSVDETGKPERGGFDLGPSWVWPQMQPALASLIEDLGLAAVEQYAEGYALFERQGQAGIETHRFPSDHMRGSMRLVGGTSSLTRALASSIPHARIRLGTRVTDMTITRSGAELALDRSPAISSLRAKHVIAALPPRVLDTTIAFVPPIEERTRRLWRGTPTWMAPHAKFLAVYDRAFWHADGFSGTAQSMIGPMSEIHDASTDDGRAAVFGFIGIDAGRRAELGEERLKQACLGQLVRLFGDQASSPRAIFIKDWANEPLTAAALDQTPTGHPEPFTGPWSGATWRDVLTLAGSETSPVDPGYLSGAVTAGRAAAEAVCSAVTAAIPEPLQHAHQENFDAA